MIFELDALSDSNLIGSGSTGKVYRAVLWGSTDVAVKKLDLSFSQAGEQFDREVDVLMKLRHPNIVTLFGSAKMDATTERILVFELLDGSLHSRLRESPALSWTSRVQVALDVSRGLAYLHGAGETPIIHRDLKSRNVLLQYSTGVAKIFPENPTNYIHSRPAGTYLDPEYLSSGRFTQSADVYSLGLVLLELLSGREPEGLKLIAEDAMEEEGDLRRLVDPELLDCKEGQYQLLSKVAMECLSDRAKRRPQLKDVLALLAGMVRGEESRWLIMSRSGALSCADTVSRSRDSEDAFAFTATKTREEGRSGETDRTAAYDRPSRFFESSDQSTHSLQENSSRIVTNTNAFLNRLVTEETLRRVPSPSALQNSHDSVLTRHGLSASLSSIPNNSVRADPQCERRTERGSVNLNSNNKLAELISIRQKEDELELARRRSEEEVLKREVEQAAGTLKRVEVKREATAAVLAHLKEQQLRLEEKVNRSEKSREIRDREAKFVQLVEERLLEVSVNGNRQDATREPPPAPRLGPTPTKAPTDRTDATNRTLSPGKIVTRRTGSPPRGSEAALRNGPMPRLASPALYSQQRPHLLQNQHSPKLMQSPHYPGPSPSPPAVKSSRNARRALNFASIPVVVETAAIQEPHPWLNNFPLSTYSNNIRRPTSPPRIPRPVGNSNKNFWV